MSREIHVLYLWSPKGIPLGFICPPDISRKRAIKSWLYFHSNLNNAFKKIFWLIKYYAYWKKGLSISEKVTTSQGLKRVQGYSTWLVRSESGSIPGTTWLAWVIWPWALTLNNHNSCWPIIHFQFHQMFPKCPARQIFLCSWSQWYVTDMHGDVYWLQFNFTQFHCLLWHWPRAEHKPIFLRNVPQFPFVWCFPMIK